MPSVPSIKHPPVAIEGRTLLFSCAVLALLITGAAGAASLLLSVPLVAGIAWFYRDPFRESPSLPLALVAPCNGRVVAIGDEADPWLDRASRTVSVRMGLFDVHTLFSPTEGKLMEQWTRAGLTNKPSAPDGARLAYRLTTDEGDEVVLEIARNLLPAPVSVAYQPGERVGHGRRLGFAALGCVVKIYAAADSRIEVEAGARVTGAASVLMSFVHETPVSAISDADVGDTEADETEARDAPADSD